MSVVMQAERLVTELDKIKSIAGLNPIAFFVIVGLVVGAIAAYVLWSEINRRKREFNRKYANNKVLAEFTTVEGNAYQKLCVVNDGQIKTYLEKGTEHPLADLIVDKSDQVKPIEAYIVRADCSYLIDWPEGARPQHQVKIKKLYYKENDPQPKIRHSGEELSKKDEMLLTAKILGTSQEEKELAIITGEMSKAFEKWEKILEKVKWIPIIALLAGGGIFISLVGAVLIFLTNGTAKQILAAVAKILLEL